VTEDTGNRDGLWDEDVDEDEQTQIAVNPLFRSSVPPSGEVSRSQSRHVSSFGSPKSARSEDEHASSRPSLYERLVQSGALDEGISGEAQRESARPLDDGLRRHSTPELLPPPDLHDLADALEGRDGDSELPRDSTEELRASDLDMVGLLPDRTMTPAVPRTLAHLPRPIPAANVPSILLGPGASTRNDVTERFSHMPSTHPLANSLSPSAPSVHPAPVAERSMPLWQVGAAALVLIGFGAVIGSYRSRVAPAPEAPSALAAAPKPAASIAVAPAAPVAAAPTVAVPAAPAVDDEAMAAEPEETAFAAADEAPAEEPMSDEERRRERRHKARAAAQAAAMGEAQALPSSEATSGQAAPSAAAPSNAAATGTPAPAPLAEPEAVRPARVQPAAAAGLPAQPSREQVVATMDAVVGELAKCVGDKHGAANVTMTVRSAGTVSHALVGGTFAGTPEGSCIARVIKQAQFPAFSDVSIRVSYPFQL